MGTRAGRTVIAAVAIGALLVVGNFVLSVGQTRQLRDESARVLHSNELLLALDDVLTLAKDAETGQRGYVITGQAEYLGPYHDAVGSINAQMDALARLIAGDPVHEALMVDVRRHVDAKLGELALTIGLRERKGFDVTKEVIALGSGRAEMDALRAAVAAMARHETELLLAREATADRSFRFAVASEAAAGVAAILALLGFWWLLVRYLRARDRAEATITAQGERLRITLASIGDAVITTDVEGRVTNMNPVAEALTGWPSGEAQGQPLDKVFDIVNEATRKTVENPATRALREGVVVGLANHTVLIARDGGESAIDDSAAPIRDRTGAVFGCVLVFRDISERKAAEDALAAAQSRLQRVVTDMAIPTMVFAEDGEVVLVNGAWVAITGYQAAEMKSVEDWTRRAYGARAKIMNAVLETLFKLDRSIDNGEREITTASGEKRIWHFVTAPIGRDERGRRMLVTNAIDVTDQRRLDAELVDSEARLRLAMDAANYGGWQWDPASGETVWTDKTRELFGVDADVPITDEMFNARVHPDDRAARREAIAGALAKGVHRHDYRIVRPDGEVRWISSRGRVVESPGHGVRLVGVVGDVTEQKRAVDALKDADRRKDEFLATLAHELRNPLAPLRNSLAILQRSIGEPATFASASGVMERQLSQLVRLIDDLLDVSRISLDKLTLRLDVADLGAIVEHAVEACRPAAERAGHTLAVSLPTEPIKLRGDRARLAQVFGNVIGNACKFTPDGGRIAIEVRRVGSDAVVTVRDNGIGIAADQLAGVFEMFAQLDTALERTHGGLGIGLTLVRRLVEMHGGSVVAQSGGRGQGSEFVVTLPLAPIADRDDADAEPKADESSEAGTPAASGALQILVVDDNDDSANSLAMLLALAGHRTHVAHDGPSALARAEALRPQAILLDLGLPGLNGYEVCRQLRDQPWARATPIIAITGWGQAEDRQRSKEAGFDGHLVKPVVFDELAALLAGQTLR
jgi:PAS domain S-box-containing protein